MHHVSTSSQRFKTSAASRLFGALPTVLLAIAALLVAIVPGAADRLQFDRTPLLAGQWYRLITCHLAHFGGEHLAWNVGVLLGLGLAAGAINPRRTLAAIGLSILAIPLAILTLQPTLQTYRGLSGIDSALFTLLAMMLLSQAARDRRWAVVALMSIGLAALIGKTAYELVTAHALFVDSAGRFVPVPLAHAVGAICGVIAWAYNFRARSDPQERSFNPHADDAILSINVADSLP